MSYRRALSAPVAALALVTVAAPARAQLHTTLSQPRVEVGRAFTVKVLLGSDAITDAKLSLPPGMTTSRPFKGIEVSFGQRGPTQSISVTWQVTPSRTGKFKVGPPTLTVDGKAVQGDVQTVEVVPAGAPSAGLNPFDPLGMMGQLGGGMFPPGLFPQLQQPPPQPEVDTTPEEMKTDKAGDPVAFLRTTLSPQHAVVGEQVTLRVYAYGSRGQFDLSGVAETSHPDFLSYNSDDTDVRRWYATTIGGTRFFTARVPNSLVLFPLHAGTLRAGGMKAGFSGNGYPSSDPLHGLVRQANLADLIVSEPPLKGRPPGYKIGDVGDYTLSVNVEPRQILAGEAVSVVATLTGTGNVPFKLITPEQADSEWLDPSVTEHVEPKNGIVQGSRTFSYVVKLSQPGEAELGELSLPFYDPKRHAYQTARAALGVVTVKPNPKPALAAQDKPVDRLASLLNLRKSLASESAAPKPLGDERGFWWLLFGAPLGVLLSGGGLSAAGQLRERLRARGQSQAAQVEQALADAERVAAADAPGAVAAIERALFGAIELKLGLKARAVLKTELSATLVARGVAEPLARELSHLLEDGDALRFIGEPSGIRAHELVAKAKTLIGDLGAAKLSAPA